MCLHVRSQFSPCLPLVAATKQLTHLLLLIQPPSWSSPALAHRSNTLTTRGTSTFGFERERRIREVLLRRAGARLRRGGVRRGALATGTSGRGPGQKDWRKSWTQIQRLGLGSALSGPLPLVCPRPPV